MKEKKSTKPSCRWVKSPWKDGVPAVYCGCPVKYTVQEGGRVYETFCPEHKAVAAKQNAEEETE